MATTTMTQTQTLPSEPTILNYYLEVKDGGIIQTYPGTAFEKRRKHVPHDVNIQDMRSRKQDFTLDTAGFQLIDFVSEEKDFTDPERIKQIWYPEVERQMKEKLGASEVKIISHMTRRNTTAEARADATTKDDSVPVTLNNPARFVHVDQSYRGAEQILYLNLDEEEADRRIKKRWAIVNIWHPFGKPVKRDPLALCDFRSIDEKDFRTVVANLPPPGAGEYGNVSRNFKHKGKWEYSLNGEQAPRYEVANMAYNPDQRWYYCSDMTPEEAWIFKIFDSKTDVARCAVHSSFPYKDQPDEGEARTSAEVRAFVFWDDE